MRVLTAWSRCYLGGVDSEPPPELGGMLSPLPCFHKPTTNIMKAEGFAPWLERAMRDAEVRTLVVVGCTTTSCVRVSSQAVAAAYGGEPYRPVL